VSSSDAAKVPKLAANLKSHWIGKKVRAFGRLELDGGVTSGSHGGVAESAVLHPAASSSKARAGIALDLSLINVAASVRDQSVVQILGEVSDQLTTTFEQLGIKAHIVRDLSGSSVDPKKYQEAMLTLARFQKLPVV